VNDKKYRSTVGKRRAKPKIITEFDKISSKEETPTENNGKIWNCSRGVGEKNIEITNEKLKKHLQQT
jgi:hypothetical protein